jgi:threonine dehydrogenase-like Zn-dependent dehydrogenase
LQITPQSIPRLQKHGMLSFFSGNKDDAAEDLDRTARLGLRSKMFDVQSLVLLCLVYFDKKDSKEFKRALANLAMLAQKKPESLRLQRFVRNCEVLLALIERKSDECARAVVELGGEKTLPQSLRCIRPGGTIAMIGILSGSSMGTSLGYVITRQVRLQGVTVGHRDGFEAMVRAIDLHQIKPVIDRVFAFEELKEAFDYLKSGAQFGKICLQH